jgi:peptidoglycan/xylan/chitin deacetylase (PgdA/CDA1 family)
MKPHGIMFHHFRDASHPAGQGAMSEEEFRRVLRYVAARSRILPAREFLARQQASTLRDDDVCLTFDDNLRCQYDVAFPILRELGLTAFCFAYTTVFEGGIDRLEVYRHFRTTRFAAVEAFYDAFFRATTEGGEGEAIAADLAGFRPDTYLSAFPFYTDADRRFRFVRDEVLGPARYHAVMDRMLAAAYGESRPPAHDLWMTPQRLRELHREGYVIGLHSHTHPTRIERMSGSEQLREYEANMDALTRVIGEPPVTMSHPCNSYNADTLALLRRLGIQVGFRANMAPAAPGEAARTEFELPREDHANVFREADSLYSRSVRRPAA